MPMMTTPIIKRVVAIGRRIKGSEIFIVGRRERRRLLQFAAGLLVFLATLSLTVLAMLAAMARSARGGCARGGADHDLRAGLKFILAIDDDFLAFRQTTL